MPWFITSLVTTKIPLPKRITDKRCFGFYNTHTEAVKAVTENRGNIEEVRYDMVVVEYMEEGIHPEVLVEFWWKWDDTERCWSVTGRPIDFAGITNFALG
jgi:hypothetical protein